MKMIKKSDNFQYFSTKKIYVVGFYYNCHVEAILKIPTAYDFMENLQ